MRERRKSLGLGQADLAELSGVSLHSILNLETAKANPSLKGVTRILEVIGLELRIEVRSTETES